MKKNLVISAALAVILAAGTARADKPRAPASSGPAAATLAEIKKTLGFVPAFVRAVPVTLLPAWWQATVAFEESADTRLDGKTKQLIALGVAAQVPCGYCVYYHSQAARTLGATDEELREAVAMAASVRQNSTIMNGMQVDLGQFKRDVDRIFKATAAK